MYDSPTVGLAAPGACSPDAPAAHDPTTHLDELAASKREIAALKAELDERNARWSALYQTAILFAQRIYSGDILTQIVNHSISLLQAHQGVLLEFDPVAGDLVARVAVATNGPPPLRVGLRVKPGEGLTGRAWQTGEAQVIDEYRRWPGRVAAVRSERMRAAATVPLVGRHGIVGVLGVASEAEGRRFSDQDIQTLMLFAQQAAAVLEAAAGRRLERELLVRNERRRLAQELHDGAQQRLAALLLKVDACQAVVGDANPALFTCLEEVASELQGLMREMRSTVRVLHDSELNGRSLADALRALVSHRANETGLRIRLEVEPLRREGLAPQTAQTLLRFVREALSNTQKHARASEVIVRLEPWDGDTVRLSVADNGRGTIPANSQGEKPSEGFGLLSLREQVEALGGSFGLDSTPNHGTTVWAVIPAAEVDGANSSVDR